MLNKFSMMKLKGIGCFFWLKTHVLLPNQFLLVRLSFMRTTSFVRYSINILLFTTECFKLRKKTNFLKLKTCSSTVNKNISWQKSAMFMKNVFQHHEKKCPHITRRRFRFGRQIFMALFISLKSQAEKYRWLICCERKTLYHDW